MPVQTDVTALRGILERLEKATGPSFELDRDIGLAIGGWRQGDPINDWPILIDSAGNGFSDGSGAIYDECFTESLDVALALAERVLPPINAFAPDSPSSSGWKINLYRGMTPTGEPHASWECCIRPHAGREGWHRAPTAALAVCVALVSALIADRERQRNGRGDGSEGGEG